MSLGVKDVRAAIWRGTGFLDARVPGWRDKINLKKLDLSSPQFCVLGEIYGYYSTGIDSLFSEGGNPCDYGFELPEKRGAEKASTVYRRMTAEWRAAYRAGQRRAKATQ